jgi:hypothetical protein
MTRNTDADLEAELYGAVLRRIEPVQQGIVAMIRREGFVFETPLHESEGWEKLAFTLYSTICEIDSWVRAALEEDGDA